jgi:hypothetical protein
MLYAIATNTHVKLGFSRTKEGVYKRLQAIQTGNPQQCTIAWIIDGDRSTERRLHQRLAHYRCHGEWFKVEVLEFLNPSSIHAVLW